MVLNAQRTQNAMQFSKHYYRTFSEYLSASELLTDRFLVLRSLVRVRRATVPVSDELQHLSQALQADALIDDEELQQVCEAQTNPAGPQPTSAPSPHVLAPRPFSGPPVSERAIEALCAALVQAVGPVGRMLAVDLRARAPSQADAAFWVQALAETLTPDDALRFRILAKQALARFG